MVWRDNHDLPFPEKGAPLNRFGWKITAAQPEDAKNPLHNALDGRLGSYSSMTKAHAMGDWIQVEMPAEQTFDHLLLQGEVIRDFQVLVSRDGQNWGKPVATVKGNASQTAQATFSPQTARFLRVVANGMKEDKWWTIRELELWNSQAALPPAPATVALDRTGWTATASARSTWNGEWEDKALDVDKATRFTTGRGINDGDMFTLDMKAPQTFLTLLLDTGGSPNGFARNIEVFVSDDGEDFSRRITGVIGAPVSKIVLDTPVTTRFVRFVNRHALPNEWWTISDLQVLR